MPKKKPSKKKETPKTSKTKEEAPMPETQEAAAPTAPTTPATASPTLAPKIKDLMHGWWSSTPARALVGEKLASGLSAIEKLEDDAVLAEVGIDGDAAIAVAMHVATVLGLPPIAVDNGSTFGDIVNAVAARLDEAGRGKEF